MTKDEYIKTEKKLTINFKNGLQVLNRNYVNENKKHSVGDIIQDHCCKILVEKIRYSTPATSKFPEAVYFGAVLKKDNTPRKDSSTYNLYESNLI